MKDETSDMLKKGFVELKSKMYTFIEESKKSRKSKIPK